MTVFSVEGTSQINYQGHLSVLFEVKFLHSSRLCVLYLRSYSTGLLKFNPFSENMKCHIYIKQL